MPDTLTLLQSVRLHIRDGGQNGDLVVELYQQNNNGWSMVYWFDETHGHNGGVKVARGPCEQAGPGFAERIANVFKYRRNGKACLEADFTPAELAALISDPLPA